MADGVIDIAKLFIDNINEFAKIISRDVQKTNTLCEDIDKKLNTPPRNEELHKSIICLNKKIEAMDIIIAEMHNSVKSTLRTIIVGAGLFSIALLISNAVISYFGIIKYEKEYISKQSIVTTIDKDLLNSYTKRDRNSTIIDIEKLLNANTKNTNSKR